MTLPTPYIGFTGQAREAMEFYRSVFGGTLTISTYGEYGFDDAPADAVMHSSLTSDDISLQASDAPPGMPTREGSQISLSLFGPKAEEEKFRGWFAQLAEGGTVSMPLEKQVWGDLFGQLTDRFGIDWMVDVGQE